MAKNKKFFVRSLVMFIRVHFGCSCKMSADDGFWDLEPGGSARRIKENGHRRHEGHGTKNHRHRHNRKSTHKHKHRDREKGRRKFNPDNPGEEIRIDRRKQRKRHTPRSKARTKKAREDDPGIKRVSDLLHIDYSLKQPLRQTNSDEQLSVQIVRRKRKKEKEKEKSEDNKQESRAFLFKPLRPDRFNSCGGSENMGTRSMSRTATKSVKRKTRRSVGSPAHIERRGAAIPQVKLTKDMLEDARKKERAAKSTGISKQLNLMLTKAQREEMAKTGATTIPNYTADGRPRLSGERKKSLLQSTKDMGTFNIDTKARTFNVALWEDYSIRGVYVSVDDVALLFLQDLIRVLSDMDTRTGKKYVRSFSSESSEDSSESLGNIEDNEAETVASLLKKIPETLQGVDVVYYRGSEKETTVAPEGTYEAETSMPLSKAHGVYEDVMRTPMMRATDVYAQMVKEAAVHRQQYIFGLIACLEPYVPDSSLVSSLRGIQKEVARDFCKLPSTRLGMLPGCVFIKTRCSYMEEVKRIKTELQEQCESRRQAWKTLSDMNVNLAEAKKINQTYTETVQRLLKEKEELGSQIIDLQSINKNLKHIIVEQEEDLDKQAYNTKLLLGRYQKLEKEHDELVDELTGNPSKSRKSAKSVKSVKSVKSGKLAK